MMMTTSEKGKQSDEQTNKASKGKEVSRCTDDMKFSAAHHINHTRLFRIASYSLTRVSLVR